jgi:translation initiation factor IF-2
MTDVTVKQFAEVVGVPADRLLVQLGEAGLAVSDENATISDSEKTQLLEYLRQSHGKRSALSAGGAGKITLKRKTQTELRATVPAGRGPAARGLRTARPETKTVTVEVRKKRTYVKRADLMAEEQERLEKEAEEKARIRAEAEARPQSLPFHDGPRVPFRP